MLRGHIYTLTSLLILLVYLIYYVFTALAQVHVSKHATMHTNTHILFIFLVIMLQKRRYDNYNQKTINKKLFFLLNSIYYLLSKYST